MNSTNQTLLNSTLPEDPLADPPAGLPPLVVFLQTTFANTSLAICLFDFAVLILVCAKGIYSKYPSVLIRWVLYCDVLLYLYYFLENNTQNALYYYFKVRPPDFLTCTLISVATGNLSRSIMFLSTGAVFCVYRITSSKRSTAGSNEQRNLKILFGAFWGFNLVLIILSLSGGFKIVNGRCRIAIDPIRQIRFYNPLTILLIQCVFILGICYNLIRTSRGIASLSSKRRRICNIPRNQVFMVLRFFIIFVSEIVRFVPGLLSIFANVRIDITLLLWFALAGGVIDGLSALTNRKIIGRAVSFPKYVRSTRVTSVAATKASASSKVTASDFN